jgi:choline dehydrogenase-like flavoprotein
MTMTYDVVVVGSGPGGAVTARECARRGLKVLVLEEGDRFEPGAVPPYSVAQMRRMYRDHGLTVALGRPSITYTEARCVGGGSEVNAGLYHRPDASVLAEWTARFDVAALTPADLESWHLVVEDRLRVERRRTPLPPASEVLRRGAEQLGWSGLEVPRWASLDGSGRPAMHTMQRTYLDDALQQGCEIRPRTRVRRLEISGGAVRRVVCDSGEAFQADRVVVSAGAVQTPALLQRSGVAGRFGRGLSVHPTVKAVARFASIVTDPDEVPAYQVKEFAPDLTLGGSASREPLVALALGDTWSRDRDLLAEPRRNAVYYASIRSSGTGLVRAVPGFEAPMVTYRLTRRDLDLLRSGLARLLHLLLAAGAERVVPCYPGAPVVRGEADVAAASSGLGRDAALMTVHLTGTAPMGERPERCPVDSFGSVRSVANLQVNDGSLLPSAPGVNPQGTIMAVAHRNVARLLGPGAGSER